MILMIRTSIVVLFLACVASSSLAKLTSDQLEQARKWIATPRQSRPSVESLELPSDLSKQDAALVKEQLWHLVSEQLQKDSPLSALPDEVHSRVQQGQLRIDVETLELGEFTMPYVVIRREQQHPPAAGRPLFICLHGGGANPDAEGPHAWPMNTQEMQAQIQLAVQVYPSEGIYWIPRMADDRLGRWWHYHNQQAYDLVINHAISQWGVDPNRVYFLGVSEGGYATDVVVPFMADRFAGASAMAAGVALGNPPENLRNVAFRTDVGAMDDMFDRRPLAVAFHQELDKLHDADPAGYQHSINVQAGRGHGIDYRPGPGWIAKHSRTPFPKTLEWIDQPLEGHRRERFYWVEWESEDRTGRNHIRAIASREENRIELVAEQLSKQTPEGHPTHIKRPESNPQSLSGARLTLLLSDELVDLDNEVEVIVNGEALASIRPHRSAGDLLATMVDRPDPSTAAAFRFDLNIP